MANENGKSVEVERDGIKLGWNVLAIMASLGLGLYVTSIVSPIKIQQEALRTDVNHLHDTLDAYNGNFNDARNQCNIFMESQILKNKSLLEDIRELKSDIKTLQGRTP